MLVAFRRRPDVGGEAGASFAQPRAGTGVARVPIPFLGTTFTTAPLLRFLRLNG